MRWPSSIGMFLLGLYLVIIGVAALVGIAIPGWAIGLLALIAGVAILVGR